MAERAELPPGEVIGSLKATTLLSLLEPFELAALAPLFGAVRFSVGEAIARAGDTDDSLWVIVDGHVAMAAAGSADREPPQIRSFGGTIGVRGVFTGARRERGATAAAPCVLLRAARGPLLALMASQPDVFDRLVLDDDVRRHLAVGDLPSAAAGEYRVALYRRHWTALAGRMVLPAALLAAMLLGAFALSALSTIGAMASPGLVLVITTCAFAIPIAVGLWSFFDYYNDVLIVTNRRIVHIERTPLIDTQRTETLLTSVQDVNTSLPSLWGRLLGYGTLTVQTASTGGQVVFTRLPHPGSARMLIVRHLDQARDAVQRERDLWVTERVRRAIGLDAAAAEDGPVARVGGEEARHEPFLVLVLESLAQMASYFWPKMRLEQGPVITWRKHWMVLVRSLLLPALILTGLVAVYALVIGGDAPLLPGVVGAAMLGAWALWRYENWRNDLYQVTDRHVIDIERLPFGFSEERRQASLSQIQDVRYRVPNPLATLLNYGNVVIQTAAEEGSFTFDSVYAPSRVQAEIFGRIQRHQEQTQREEEERRAEEMVVWLRTYHDIATGADPIRERPTRPGMAAE